MLSSADIVASPKNAEDSDDDAGDPLPYVTFHQTHSGFLDMKVYLLYSCAENGTEPLYAV